MPRNAILYIATSLDGYIAGPHHELDWLFTDQDYGFTEFMAGIDTIVMGRKSYDICAGFGQWPYDGKSCYVVTRNLRQTDPRVTFTTQDPGALVRELRVLNGKSTWVLGGGEIATQVAAAGQIDQYVIAIHPILVGRGIPLWHQLPVRIDLIFDTCRQFSSGLVILTYHRPSP